MAQVSRNRPSNAYATNARRQQFCVFFFFQAEDGIRDLTVTGVQTCALPISSNGLRGRILGLGLVHRSSPRGKRRRTRAHKRRSSSRAHTAMPTELGAFQVHIDRKSVV